MTDELQAGLPQALRDQLDAVHVPLAAWIAARRAACGRSIVVGLSGAQGTGKSTLATLLAHLLARDFGLRSVAVSLDDFYATRAQRAELAATVHPELRTRGAVGTHDVELARATLIALRDAGAGAPVPHPRFDKLRDDRAAPADWPCWVGPTDVVIFEGVYVGAEPEPEASLAEPINAFERERDADARLRRLGNAELAGRYRALWSLLDALVFLAAPSMERVLSWRTQQERGLVAATGGAASGMSASELEAFVQRFERVTRHMLATLPGRADVTLELDTDHRVKAVRTRG